MPRTFRIVSVIAHVVIVGSALVAQLLAVGPLPTPRQPLTFASVLPIAIVEPPPPRQSSPHTADRSEPSPYVAPVIAPDGVTPESPAARIETPASNDVGVDGGWPNSLRIDPVERIPPPPPPPPPPQRPI